MTTAIPDIADLVKILREQPEWAETLRAILLTPELLELPEKLARLTEQLTRLTARVEEFIAQQTEINQLIAERLARQETDTAELKSDVAELKATTGRLETDVAELKATTGRLETDVAELKSDMSKVKGTVGRLEGAELERKIHAHIAGTVCQHLEINRPQVLQSVVVSPVPELFDILAAAQAAGRIDRPQFLSLLRADIILAARDLEAQRVYMVIEISRTVHDDDLTRARERADILAAASGASVLALAMGYIIPPPQRRKAAEMGIHLLESAQLAAAGDDAD